MKFFVYHNFSWGIVYFLSHNLRDKNINQSKNYVSGFYNNTFVEFYFNSFSELEYSELSNGYHVICREEAVKKWFHLEQLSTFQDKIGFPECLKYEYQVLLKNLEFHDKKWILFWNFGENQFVHIRNTKIQFSKELKLLKKLSDSTLFFSDNHIDSNSEYNIIPPNNLLKSLTNDIFMWNYYAEITWANEFKNVFKYLSPPYKLCTSFRSPKPHRVDICKKLGNKNLDEVYITYSSMFFEKRTGETDRSWITINYDETYNELMNIPNLNINKVGFYSESDFENLNISGNNKSYMEIDYYFRILSKAKVQLLDETHSYVSDKEIPMNLSEKTYILLLANIPFISTHHYPFDLIKKHILDIDYPYYDDMVRISNNTDALVEFIDYFISNFDEMYPKIKEYTDKVHVELQRRIKNENSFLEHMTTKI